MLKDSFKLCKDNCEREEDLGEYFPAEGARMETFVPWTPVGKTEPY